MCAESSKKELSDYEIQTVTEMGWSGTKNGKLLKLMSENGFTVLLTTDQNLRYEQNLKLAGVAILVLIAYSNRVIDLLPLIAKAQQGLETIPAGQVIEVDS